MNKILHAVVLVFFGGACWFLSLMFKLPLMVGHSTGLVMPAFSRFCVAIGPFVTAGLAISALAYCIYVWRRKAESRATWIGFLATTMSALVLAVMPTVVAMYLPLVDFINRSAAH
jgi:hypothetical protein